MKRPLLTLLVFFCISSISFGQDSSYTIPNSPFLKFIRNSRFNEAFFISNYQKPLRLLDFKDPRFKNYVQDYLVLNGELFIYVPATGIVYKSKDNKSKDSIDFVRLDRTEHYGYNINAYFFGYNNSLYNIGGYGFWHWNGQLRKFSEKSKEWDIVPLNSEYYVSMSEPGSFFWKSTNSNKLVAFSYIRGNDAVRTNNENVIKSIDTLIELDLNSMDWKVKGTLNQEFTKSIKQETTFCNFDSGVLIIKGYNLLLLNVIANRVDTLNNFDVFHFYRTRSLDYVYWNTNDYIYRAAKDFNTIDSIKINSQDFRKGITPVFLPMNDYSSKSYYILPIFAIAIFGIFFRYRQSKKSKQTYIAPTNKKTEKSLASPYQELDLFDEIEKSLIKLIYENAIEKGIRTSTDEVNRILGVGNKSLDMQKRKRSDIIKSINKKYQILHPEKNQLLIDRIKSDVDARLYEYALNTENLDFIG